MDVMTAFLCGNLKKRIIMKPSSGSCKSEKLYFLIKTLYDLKQSFREWYSELSRALEELGFERNPHDNSLFSNKSSGIVILIYVDDLLIIGANQEKIRELKKSLSSKFKMKNLGLVASFLEMQIKRDRKKGTLALHQRAYIEQLLKRFNHENATTVRTPMEAEGLLYEGDQGSELENYTMYRELVRSLMYLLCTRSESVFTISTLGQYNNELTQTTWKAGLRELKYVKGASKMSLVYRASEELRLTAFADAD
jgi:hypothetical protein